MSTSSSLQLPLTDSFSSSKEDGLAQLERLRQQAKKIKAGPKAIQRRMEHTPYTLSICEIGHVLYERNRRIKSEYVTAVKEVILQWPDLPTPPKPELDPDIVNLIEETLEGQSLGQWLRSQMKAKNVGTQALINSMENQLLGLTNHILEGWIDPKQPTQTARRSYWIAIKAAIEVYVPRIDLDAPYTPKGLSRREWLIYQMNHSNVGSITVYNKIKNKVKNLPDGLESYTIQNIIDGRDNTVSPEYWAAIEAVAETLEPSRVDMHRTTTPSGQTRHGWLKAQLKRYSGRTNQVGSDELFNSMKNPPDGLTEAVLRGLISGDTKTASWEHWIAIKNHVRTLQPRIDLQAVFNRQTLLESFVETMRRKNVTTYGLFQSMKNPPPGLTLSILNDWVDGRTSTANPLHWEAANQALKELKTRKKTTKSAAETLTLPELNIAV